MKLNDFPAPNSIQSSFKGTSWWKLTIAITTTSLSTVLIIMLVCSLETCFKWTKILSSASSILMASKMISKDQPRWQLLSHLLSTLPADTFAKSQERHPFCWKEAIISDLLTDPNSTFSSRSVFQNLCKVFITNVRLIEGGWKSIAQMSWWHSREMYCDMLVWACQW